METVGTIGPRLGVAATCMALGVALSTYYRRRRPRPTRPRRPSPPRALAATERTAILELLHAPPFVDLAPAQVYARLLDAGRYLCSERTMYRLLAAHQEVRERRDQLRHPRYAAPQLLATGPNQLWSWDITKLLGPAKWTYFYLYVILDVFSRYVVGWMVAHRESAVLAERLIGETCARQGIPPGELTLHADRGSSMTSKPVALLLADLGVTKTHSRPHVSNDNPFSEAQFKTLKYRPEFPDHFGAIVEARSFCQRFFPWYNTEHHHTGLGLLTPADVHFGRAAARVAARAVVLAAAHAARPERFVRGVPHPPALPSEVWINPPTPPPTAGAEKTDRTGSPRIHAPHAGQGTGTLGHSASAVTTARRSEHAQH
jgi:putative transposase